MGDADKGINGPLAGEAMARSLAEVDPEIYRAVRQETEKQATKLVLIARIGRAHV